MRAFYTAPDGWTASLCKHLCKDQTHLIIRDAEGHTMHTWWYETWNSAVYALSLMIPGCVNDLTHQPLT